MDNFGEFKKWFDEHRPEGGWKFSAQDWMDLLAVIEFSRAAAWDEGATKASPHGGGYLRSILIENPYR